jgi:hypothetical protein
MMMHFISSRVNLSSISRNSSICIILNLRESRRKCNNRSRSRGIEKGSKNKGKLFRNSINKSKYNS